MKYVFYVKEILVTKNKLESAAREVVVELDRTQIDESDCEKFRNNIIAAIQRLNLNNPRCKPIFLCFHQSQIKLKRISDFDYSVSEPYFIRAELLACHDEVKL